MNNYMINKEQSQSIRELKKQKRNSITKCITKTILLALLHIVLGITFLPHALYGLIAGMLSYSLEGHTIISHFLAITSVLHIILTILFIAAEVIPPSLELHGGLLTWTPHKTKEIIEDTKYDLSKINKKIKEINNQKTYEKKHYDECTQCKYSSINKNYNNEKGIKLNQINSEKQELINLRNELLQLEENKPKKLTRKR